MSNELQILDLQLDLIKLLEKANPYHDRLGRFSNRMGQKGVPSLEHLDLDWSKIPSHLRYQAQKTLKDWTGDEALAIQHHLRGRSSVDEDKSSTIRVLDEVFQHAPRLTHPAVLYRYSDNIPENFHDPEFFNTNWEKVGAIFTEPGYTATDPNASFMIREHQKVVQGFQGKTAIPIYSNWSPSVNQPLKAYLIRIHVPAGTRALDLGRINQKGEKEVLLNRSSTFRVVDVNTHDPHGVILDWELVRDRVEKAGPPDEPRDEKGRWTKLSDTHTLHFEGTHEHGFHRFSIKKDGKEIGQLSVSEADDGSLWINSPAEIRMKYDDFLERDVPVAYPIKISSAIKKEIEKEMLYRYPNKTLKGYVRYKAGGPSAENLKIVRAYTNQDYVRI